MDPNMTSEDDAAKMKPHNDQGSLPQQHGLLEADDRVLPGCTANQDPTRSVVISSDMMQAYVSMRGPSATSDQGDDDPLREWCWLRQGLEGCCRLPSVGSDIASLSSPFLRARRLDDHNDELLCGDVFEILRTPIEHIHPPADMDLSMHILNECCADFKYEEDGDAEEQQCIPRGRISPCTFLAWAKGCQRWDSHELQLLSAEEPERQRPPTPEYGDTPIARKDRWPSWTVEQICLNDGSHMSPQYQVPSTPSVVWTAEGIDEDRMNWKADWVSQYSRMDPFAGRTLRRMKVSGFKKPDTASISPANTSEYYNCAEVEKVVTDKVEDLGTGVSINSVQAHIDSQHEAIITAQAEGLFAANKLREQKTQIQTLKLQREVINIAVWNLKRKRVEEAARRARRYEQERREERIRRHFREHFLDVEVKQEQTIHALAHDEGKVERNDAKIADLESDILEACLVVGKMTPEEVYKELAVTADGQSWKPRVPTATKINVARSDTLDDSSADWRAHSEYGQMQSSQYTDPLAKPSPLRFPRDRFQVDWEVFEQSQDLQCSPCRGRDFSDVDESTKFNGDDLRVAEVLGILPTPSTSKGKGVMGLNSINGHVDIRTHEIPERCTSYPCQTADLAVKPAHQPGINWDNSAPWESKGESAGPYVDSDFDADETVVPNSGRGLFAAFAVPEPHRNRWVSENIVETSGREQTYQHNVGDTGLAARPGVHEESAESETF